MNEFSISLSLTALSPVVVAGERAAGNHVRTSDFIPGSQLRGALAARIQRAGADRNLMTALFGSRGISVSNGYPVPSHGSGYLPLPLSARASKHDERTHNFVDVLLADCDTHPESGAPLIRVRAFGAVMRETGPLRPDDDTYLPPRVMSTHVEIDPATGSHREGVLFSLEALAEGTRFDARIHCSVEQATALAARLGLQREDGVVHGSAEVSVGEARSRGFGRLRIDAYGEPRRSSALPLKERLERLNCNGAATRERFTLTLAADAIVLDERLRYRAGLDVNDLLLEYPAVASIKNLTLLRAATATHIVSGWHGGAQLPRQDDLAIMAGAAFLYAYDPASQRNVIELLAQIERDGIGVRRTEGFGAVIACMPWHWRGTVLRSQATTSGSENR